MLIIITIVMKGDHSRLKLRKLLQN